LGNLLGMDSYFLRREHKDMGDPPGCPEIPPFKKTKCGLSAVVLDKILIEGGDAVYWGNMDKDVRKP
jgi:hypothetical protein